MQGNYNPMYNQQGNTENTIFHSITLQFSPLEKRVIQIVENFNQMQIDSRELITNIFSIDNSHNWFFC